LLWRKKKKDLFIHVDKKVRGEGIRKRRPKKEKRKGKVSRNRRAEGKTEQKDERLLPKKKRELRILEYENQRGEEDQE